MTLEEQRQIMLSGAMYNDLTPELIRARENAVRLADRHECEEPAVGQFFSPLHMRKRIG